MFLPASLATHRVAVQTRRLTDEQKETLDPFARLYDQQMTEWAKNQLHSCRGVERLLPAEEVVQGALQRLCRAIADGTMHEIQTEHDFVMAVHLMLKRSFIDARRWRGSRKHGGRGTTDGGPARVLAGSDVDLDGLPSHEPTAQEAMSLGDDVERWLSLLDARDPLLRTIAVLAMDFTNQEIADRLGVSLSTVERGLRTIRER
jgi:DNA-directed RNA polymerase specialized sigma24 family protein